MLCIYLLVLKSIILVQSMQDRKTQRELIIYIKCIALFCQAPSLKSANCPSPKNIFVYKLLLSLNISDFKFFYVKTAAPWKKYIALSQQPPLKIEILSNPHFWKFRRRLNPPAEMGDGENAHYDLSKQCFTRKIWLHMSI